MKKRTVTTMFIKPVQRTSVQGRSNYHYVSPTGELINANRSFAKDVGKIYNFPATSDGTAIVTGLGRMVDNPWYNKDPKNVNEGLPEHYFVGANWMNQVEKLVTYPEITKQLELEVRFNKPEGFLTDQKNLHFSLRQRKDSDKANYLETFQAVFYDRSNRLDDTTLRSALIMELAKVSKKIAKDKDAINPSKHDFFIATEDEAVIERNNKQDIINDAITDLTLLRRNFTFFVRYQVAVVLGQVKGIVNEHTLKGALNSFIASNTKTQLKNIDKFNELYALIQQGKEGLEKLWIKYLIQQALNSHVMSVNSGHYIWHSKKDVSNLFDLGSNEKKVFKLFYDEFIKYGEEDIVENHYNDLLQELKTKGIKTEE